VVDTAVAEQRLVGTVVLVARDGKVVYHRAAGLADREAGRPMREDAVFRFSSVTKPFVSVAVMKLVEDGVLRLDDPVTRWLPDFKPKLADGTTPVITLRQLLNHTSGLTYGLAEKPSHPYHTLGVSDGIDNSGSAWTRTCAAWARRPWPSRPARPGAIRWPSTCWARCSRRRPASPCPRWWPRPSPDRWAWPTPASWPAIRPA
jgi:CubicO group peptidase (beta-lactamase class C family)